MGQDLARGLSRHVTWLDLIHLRVRCLCTRQNPFGELWNIVVRLDKRVEIASYKEDLSNMKLLLPTFLRPMASKPSRTLLSGLYGSYFIRSSFSCYFYIPVSPLPINAYKDSWRCFSILALSSMTILNCSSSLIFWSYWFYLTMRLGPTYRSIHKLKTTLHGYLVLFHITHCHLVRIWIFFSTNHQSHFNWLTYPLPVCFSQTVLIVTLCQIFQQAQ